ncbi:O-antigen ligase family protein [Candidatus Saccharibacteria bacterium]|nr:O-antigen ligase family protein [Candidatus Saccharibacteria bacterium]
MKKSPLRKIQKALLFAAPAALFFSYHPVISLGGTESMNFEFSLAEIWLILFSLASLVDLKDFFKFYGKKLFLLLAFPAYAALSLLWTPNRLRALLTVGLLFLLFFVGLNIYYQIKKSPKKLPLLQKILVLSAAVFSAFCWLQCVLDLLGVDRSATLLCRGCTYYAFGFPHPNGLAIEPQFAGNLLLAPALLMTYGLVTKKYLFKKPAHLLLTFFLTTTVFLTFSRGAIYALMIGFAVIFFLRFPVIKSNEKKSRTVQFNPRAFLLIPVALVSFGVALTAQGLFSEFSPTNDTFFSGVAKSIHQLSLGKIDLRPAEAPTSSDPTTTFSAIESAEEVTDSVYTGYVENSTAFRAELTHTALDIWNDSPTNLLFGTGLGSAGIKLLEKNPDFGIEKEIVQNQYASILLELGLVGALLALATLVFILKNINLTPLFLATLFSYAVTLFFFAGLPNALHVYLFLILVMEV